jgi:hypothetical protein
MTRTPALVKVTAASVLLFAAAWWFAQMRTLHANEARLSAISSRIAEHAVKVDCPGPLSRLSGWDTMEGTADIEGGVSHLRPLACAEADALARGKRTAALACAVRGNDCADSVRLALAVDVVTHEAVHLSTIYDEGLTECRSIQTMASTAEQLGATPAEARALARIPWQNGYQELPARYRAEGCEDGGRLDLRPRDPNWPS